VNSYVIWKDADTTVDATAWEYCGSISNVSLLAGETSLKVKYYVGDNVEYDWNLVASTGTVASDPDGVPGGAVVGKAAAGAVIVYETGAAKIATTPSTAVFATGRAIDNIAPSAITGFAAIDNAGDNLGILISWDACDIVDYGKDVISGALIPIYGVNSYEIYYRVKGTTDYLLAGTKSGSSVSFVHEIVKGPTIYNYYVKAVDGYLIDHPEESVETFVRSAIATTDVVGDFTGSGNVGLADFRIFALNYGMKDTDPNFVKTMDLVINGAIDLGDFRQFALAYSASAGKVAKAAVELPESNVPFSLAAEVDVTSSITYITVNIGEFEMIDGYSFTLAYDSDKLEFIDDSIVGTVGLTIPTVIEKGVINISSFFLDQKFEGSVTLGFRSLETRDDINVELAEVLVADSEGIKQVNDLAKLSIRAVPAVYSLSQNYPNPFNPTTTIDYSIPESGHVELAIYNLAGQKVRTLVNETKQAAFYKVVWDGKNDMGESVASGLYFYRLVSSNFSKIEKMTLIK